VLLCAACELAAFLADVLLPPHVATGGLYAAVVLLGLWFNSTHGIFVLACVSTFLAVLGIVVAPGTSTPDIGYVLTTRGFIILVIWGVGLMAARHHASGDALRQTAGRLQAILDTALEAIVVIDQRGRMETFNPAAERLFGYRSEDVIGQNVRMLMPSPDREAHDGYLDRYHATRERRIIGVGRVVKGQRNDGSVFPLELAVGEMQAAGKVVYVGFLRDLTARERIEQELRQSQKMEAIGQLTGGIAHDFNNLLTVVLGNLEMLESRLTDPEQRLMLSEAQETAQLGAQLTQRLLAFGRRQPLAPRPIDVRQHMNELLTVLRRTLGETIELQDSIPGALPLVLADPGQLQNAILNLALNARDAMPSGGKLALTAATAELDADYASHHPGTRVGHFVMLTVADTGTGMPPEVRERAFEPFFTTKATGAGTGLGLSMVYGFVMQTGGHIELYSEVGHGTTVKLYLPLAEQPAPALSPAAPELAAFAGKGETILVVEDDDRVRRLARKRLESLGYRVLEAPDGPAALALLGSNPKTDLLFTDMVMPGGLTGVELAHRAREQRPGLAVVITSGYAEPESFARGLPRSAIWLSKPYTTAELARGLRAVLDGVEVA
jgi:PAS domain S-box-containing protein